MNHLLKCRRTFIAILSIVLLAALGFYTKNTDVAMAISTIAVGLAGANAYQKSKHSNDDKKSDQ